MSRKIFAFVLALAVMAVLFVVPASAETLSDFLILNVDFSTESYEDQTGNVAAAELPGTEFRNGTIEYEDNEEIGRKVAHFRGMTVKYDLADYNAMTDEFSIEAYFNVKKQGSFGIIAGDYFFNTKSGAAITVGKFAQENDSVGYSKGIAAVEGTGTGSITVEGTKDKSFGQWIHGLLVHEHDKLRFYVNGELVNEIDTVAPLPNDTLQGFRIGGYNLADQFQVEDIMYSYVRVYDTVITAEEAVSLYEARNNGAPVDPGTQDPTAEPVDQPTQAPTKAPANPTQVPAQPTKAPTGNNPSTFDAGLLPLVAVVLSGLVVVKKRKR